MYAVYLKSGKGVVSMTSYKKVISLLMGTALIAGASIATASAHEDGDKAGKKGHHMFQKMDTNGDGKISAAEHAAMAANWFKKMDTNSDGFVSKKEMQKHHKKMKGKHGKPCNKS